MLLERLAYFKTSFWQVFYLEGFLWRVWWFGFSLYFSINLDNMQSLHGGTEVMDKGRKYTLHPFWCPEFSLTSHSDFQKQHNFPVNEENTFVSQNMQESPSYCCSQLWLKLAASQGFVTGVLGTLYMWWASHVAAWHSSFRSFTELPALSLQQRWFSQRPLV